MSENSKASDSRRGLVVISALAVLTAVEFGLSSALGGPLAPMAVIALIKTGLIIQYFMHLPRAIRFDDEGGGH